jgi:hypothetical protein
LRRAANRIKKAAVVPYYRLQERQEQEAGHRLQGWGYGLQATGRAPAAAAQLAGL